MKPPEGRRRLQATTISSGFDLRRDSRRYISERNSTVSLCWHVMGFSPTSRRPSHSHRARAHTAGKAFVRRRSRLLCPAIGSGVACAARVPAPQKTIKYGRPAAARATDADLTLEPAEPARHHGDRRAHLHLFRRPDPLCSHAATLDGCSSDPPLPLLPPCILSDRRLPVAHGRGRVVCSSLARAYTRPLFSST